MYYIDIRTFCLTSFLCTCDDKNNIIMLSLHFVDVFRRNQLNWQYPLVGVGYIQQQISVNKVVWLKIVIFNHFILLICSSFL